MKSYWKETYAPNLLEHVFFHVFGWVVRLHKITGEDAQRFHSHPADYAIRIILKGGYLEERLYEDDQFEVWEPGNIGIVRHNLHHRIAALLDGPCISFWIRGPKRHKVIVTPFVRRR